MRGWRPAQSRAIRAKIMSKGKPRPQKGADKPPFGWDRDRVGRPTPRTIIVDIRQSRPGAVKPHTSRGPGPGTRTREPCPADKIRLATTTTETTTNINRLRSHTSTRSGAAAIVEATTGIGQRPIREEPIPKDYKASPDDDGWFTPFLEGYDGVNPALRIKCNGKTTTCVLDTGAGCNLIGTDTLHEICPNFHDNMRTTTTRARDVRNKPVPLAGKIELEVVLGGNNPKRVMMEVVQDQDMLILGNPLLYEEDLVIIAREGLGTRTALPSGGVRKRTPVYKIYTTETQPLERNDVVEVRVSTDKPLRTWAVDINRPFLIGADPVETQDTPLHPTLSTLHSDGTLIALVDTRGLAQDTVLEKGTYLGTASADFTQAEQVVTKVMADLTDIERDIRHVSATQMIEGEDTLDGSDMEIEPPGFELEGPKTGVARRRRNPGETKYDTERENEGATPETAMLHTKDPREREKMRELLKKHRNLFSRSNYDIGHFVVSGSVQKVKLTLSDSTPIVEKYRNLSPAKRAAAEQILNELERAKIISRKASQFASQAVWVTKAAPELTVNRAKELGIPFVPGSKDPSAPRNLRFC